MTSKRGRGGGSFRDIRDRHLPIFEWPKERRESGVAPAKPKPRRQWKRDGIVHFAVDDPE